MSNGNVVSNAITFIVIVIVIYCIIAYGTIFKDILNDIDKIGNSTTDAVVCTFEKLTCCIDSCPGSGTPCSASQIASIKNNKGCNICTNCSGGPCYLPSFKGGMSCKEIEGFTGGYIIASTLIVPLLLGLLKMYYKSNNTTEQNEKLEASNKSVDENIKYQAETELNEKDFEDLGIENEEDKVDYRKFIKEYNTPDKIKNLSKDNVPKKLLEKYGGDLDKVKIRLNTRGKGLFKVVKYKLNKWFSDKFGDSDKSFQEEMHNENIEIENNIKKQAEEANKEEKEKKESEESEDSEESNNLEDMLEGGGE